MPWPTTPRWAQRGAPMASPTGPGAPGHTCPPRARPSPRTPLPARARAYTQDDGIFRPPALRWGLVAVDGPLGLGTGQSGSSASWWGREGSPHPRACSCMRPPAQPNPTPPPPPRAAVEKWGTKPADRGAHPDRPWAAGGPCLRASGGGGCVLGGVSAEGAGAVGGRVPRAPPATPTAPATDLPKPGPPRGTGVVGPRFAGPRSPDPPVAPSSCPKTTHTGSGGGGTRARTGCRGGGIHGPDPSGPHKNVERFRAGQR